MVYERVHYTLLEYIGGRGFPSFLGKKTIMKTILSAIKYLHGKGFSHGSISIQTILVQEEGDVYCVKLGHFSNVSPLGENGYAK